MANGKAGRRTKYTPETVKTICDGLRVGLPIASACIRAGVSDDTYARWIKQYAEFAESVQKALSDCQAAKLARIETAGRNGTWQADAWVLERRWPDLFGQKNTYRLDPQQLAILMKHGLTPLQAMEQLVNSLEEEDVAN